MAENEMKFYQVCGWWEGVLGRHHWRENASCIVWQRAVLWNWKLLSVFQSGNLFPKITNKLVSQAICQVQALESACLNGLCQCILVHPTFLCQLHCWLDTDGWHCSVPLWHFINNIMCCLQHNGNSYVCRDWTFWKQTISLRASLWMNIGNLIYL